MNLKHADEKTMHFDHYDPEALRERLDTHHKKSNALEKRQDNA